MGTSDCQKWPKIFDAVAHVLKTQQTHAESPALERKLLEGRAKLQFDRRPSDMYLLRDQISMMKRDLAIRETALNAEAAKVDLVLGMKQREAFLHKIKADEVISEMADSRVDPDYLSHKSRETSENSSRVLALLLEGDFAGQRKSESNEVEQAKEKIKELADSLDRLQSSNNEKDSLIVTLKATMAKLEAESTTKSEEISRLSRELESLRKTRSSPVTPIVRRCSAKSRLGDKRKVMDERSITPKKGSNPSQISEKGCRSSKRKAVGAVAASEQGRFTKGQLPPGELLK
ncbi:hypothetical protein NMG60_11024446 [Bertholletia excelsa]